MVRGRVRWVTTIGRTIATCEIEVEAGSVKCVPTEATSTGTITGWKLELGNGDEWVVVALGDVLPQRVHGGRDIVGGNLCEG